MNKKLQRCPGCGKGGFVNLKSHVCKGSARASRAGAGASPATRVHVELVAEPNEKRLQECASEIRRMHGVIDGKTRRFQEEVIYDFVEWGLYFLQAKAEVGHGNFIDFLKSDTVSDLNIQERAAQRYMNAARGAGLNENSTPKDIATLRRTKALHGRTLGDISQPLLGDGEPNEPEQTTYNLVRDELTSLREHCENIENLRETMSKKAYSTACARLHRTLEALTKCPWDMVKRRRPEPLFKEHGDVYEIGS